MHKKYTRVKGKVYGPYLYENKRVNGKVVTSYLGKVKSKARKTIKSLFLFFGLFLVLISFASAGILEKSGILITGNVVDGSTDVTDIPVGQIDYGQIVFYLIIGIIVLATLVSSVLLYRFIKRKMLERRYEQIRPTFNWQQ